ncbi:MAG: sigma-70 family RNA polymerase sigma factor [Nibricoccus sp.]
MSPNDRDLLLRFARNGDQDAFGVLVRQYIGLVYHSALRSVGDAHAAEDIAQQVFTLLARKAAKVCSHETLIGWLHTTTRLEAHQFLRRERRRAAREKEALMHDDLPSPNPVQDWERLRPVIDVALDQLRATDRDAVLMRFFNNQSFAAIGEQLGMTENAARMRVDRALDKLNGILSSRKITTVSLAAALATEAVAASTPPALAAQVSAQALTGAMLGAGSGITATIFTMTTSSKIIVVASCILVAIGAGSAFYERRQLAESRAQFTAIKHQIELAHADEKVDKVRIASLEKELANAKLAQNGVIKPPSMPVPRAQLWYSNPEYARLSLEQFRASLSGKYGPLYRAMHLSSDQIAAFEAIQVECQQGVIDIWAAAESQGIASGSDNSASTSVARMTSAPVTLRDEKLKALLGDDNMKQYVDYDGLKGRPAVTFVPMLAGDLYTAGTPLAVNQGDQLRQTIVNHTKVTKEPMASDGGTPIYRIVSQTDWNAVAEDAGAFLSEEQLAVLKKRTAVEAADAQLKQMNRASAK